MSANSSQTSVTAQPIQSSTLTQDHIFNDDLLLYDTDIAYAQSHFPKIFHVLDHPRLREKFAQYDKEANRARDRVRTLGIATVLAATLALLVVATKPVWPQAHGHAGWPW